MTLDVCDYSECYQKEELEDLPPLECDKEKYYSVPSTPLSKCDK